MRAAPENYLSAQNAAKELGVSTPTLYAYVSRGLVRSEPVSLSKRSRRYSTEDIEQLKTRKLARRDPAQVATQSLQWGAPILDSAIALISEGRIYYRGHDAVELAMNRQVEEVASLIWMGEFQPPGPALFADSGAALPAGYVARVKRGAFGVQQRFQIALTLAEGEDEGAYNYSVPAVAYTGARILKLMVSVATGRDYTGAPLARLLQQAWVPGKPAAAKLFNAILIMSANNELSVSTFTARCVASAGAPLYSAAMAALCAAQGSKTGAQAERVQALFDEVHKAGNARGAIAACLRRGEPIPGFGHRLYPHGDPRVDLLIQLIAKAYPRSPTTAAMETIGREVRQLIGELHPNMYFARVALGRVLQLPHYAVASLGALGNVIAWIGHAIEEYQSGRIIRPRARYTGPLPLVSQTLR
ncbi:MAG: citrate/2-methylcitrate synthase [Candidatus Binataceae bacterium]